MSQKTARPSVARMPGMPQILLTFGLTICSLSILLPASPAWALAGGAGSLGAGATNAVLMAVTVATQFSVPALTRRFSWALVLPVGTLFMGLPSLIQALSPDLLNVLITSGLRGIGFGIVTVCCSSAMSYLIPVKYRGRAVGLYGLAAAGSQMFFTPVAPWALDTFGYRSVISAGAIAAIAAPFALQLGRLVDHFMEEQRAGEQGSDATPATSTATIIARIWPALLTLTLVTSVGGAFMTFSTEIAPTATLATGALLLLCALATPTRLYGGSLTDRFGTRLLMTPVLALTALGVAFVGWVNGASLPSIIFLLAGATLIGFGYGFLQSVTMVRALTDAGGPDATQRASVAWNSHFDVGTGLGSLAIGAAAQATSFTAAWTGAAVLLLACALLLGLKDARASVQK
ncbi:MFS transporter [Rothia nasimurium]|uniref:MFS transporter n=1 Tax=Rothia nasimurium TaxID=85336 RepID=UPI001F005355|nr:MFS transporter [Rothia nasimurium]